MKSASLSEIMQEMDTDFAAIFGSMLESATSDPFEKPYQTEKQYSISDIPKADIWTTAAFEYMKILKKVKIIWAITESAGLIPAIVPLPVRNGIPVKSS